MLVYICDLSSGGKWGAAVEGGEGEGEEVGR